MEVSTSYSELFPAIEEQVDFKLQNEIGLKALYCDAFARGFAGRRPGWARSSACAAQQYCGSVSFVSAHVPLLYNACSGDVTQQCVGIT
jgi:hypothetical protein